MANGSRYYWIKLRTDFFNQQTIDFILSQKNGCEYIVLYQMLCLQTANNDGELSTKIGEIIIPYDVEKIVRDTKHFDFDTVTMAIELFKRLGLIYESDNSGILRISNYSQMIGSETDYAEKQRKYRDEKQIQTRYNVSDNVSDNVGYNVRQDIKILDIRDKEIRDIDKDNILLADKSAENKKVKRFVKPTVEEIQAYCTERNNNIDAETFFDFYEANGWVQGRSGKPLKDWKAAVRTWEKNRKQKEPENRIPTDADYDFSDWYSEGIK